MTQNGELFGEWYYNNNCGQPYLRTKEWLDFFGSVAESIRVKLNPGSVLDAGCAKGFLVETLRDRNIDARGIDLSAYAINEVYEPVKPYCAVGSITEPFSQHFDLIVCIEVLEHMPALDATLAVKNMCNHTDTILFSSSPTDYSEATHFNVRQPEYWVREFAYNGFVHDLDFDASFLTSWAMLFRRQKRVLADTVYDYERHWTEIRTENTDLRRKNNELESKFNLYQQMDHQNSKKVQATESDELDSERYALRKKIQEADEELARTRSQCSSLIAENAEIRSSTSWRITQPLRALKNLLTKR